MRTFCFKGFYFPRSKPVERFLMILLTKLDNKKILVSLESVKYIESVPDTIIFFTNGDSLVVKESLLEVEESVTQHRRKVIGATRQ